MVFMVDKDRIGATKKLPSLTTGIVARTAVMLLVPLLKSVSLHQLIHYLSRMHFYAVGGATQHKTILPSKTNLSPAQERLENAADAVNRMQEGSSKIRSRQFVLRLWLGPNQS